MAARMPIKRGGKQDKLGVLGNRGHLLACCVFLLLSSASLFFDMGGTVGQLSGPWFSMVVAYFAIVLIDIYLGLLLAEAAYQGTAKLGKQRLGLPDRGLAILLFFILLTCQVLAFARIGMGLDMFKPSSGSGAVAAAYQTFVAMATLNSEAFSSLLNPWQRLMAVVQLGSGMLLLLMAVPLLVSRLAVFREDAIHLTVVKNGSDWSIKHHDTGAGVRNGTYDVWVTIADHHTNGTGRGQVRSSKKKRTPAPLAKRPRPKLGAR